MKLFETVQFQQEFGTVRVEEWPEGIVLWVGGRIRWKSWECEDFLCTRLSERGQEARKIAAILGQID